MGAKIFMNNDIAIFLDLDNLVIGAIEANLTFDIDLVLEHINSLSDGRIVLRRAYGDWRQRANLTKELASAGFELQSTVRLSANSKNLADMQMVVDAMSTLSSCLSQRSRNMISGEQLHPLISAIRFNFFSQAERTSPFNRSRAAPFAVTPRIAPEAATCVNPRNPRPSASSQTSQIRLKNSSGKIYVLKSAASTGPRKIFADSHKWLQVTCPQ